MGISLNAIGASHLLSFATNASDHFDSSENLLLAMLMVLVALMIPPPPGGGSRRSKPMRSPRRRLRLQAALFLAAATAVATPCSSARAAEVPVRAFEVVVEEVLATSWGKAIAEYVGIHAPAVTEPDCRRALLALGCSPSELARFDLVTPHSLAGKQLLSRSDNGDCTGKSEKNLLDGKIDRKTADCFVARVNELGTEPIKRLSLKEIMGNGVMKEDHPFSDLKEAKPDFAELLKAYCHGDNRAALAFERVLKVRAERFWKTLDLRDITQETLLEISEQVCAPEDGGARSAGAWLSERSEDRVEADLFKLADRVRWRMSQADRRSRRTEPLAEHEEALVDDSPSQEDRFADVNLLLRIGAKLTPYQQQVLILRDAGYSYSEIGYVLERSKGAVAKANGSAVEAAKKLAPRLTGGSVDVTK
jgi:DNA-directed RNA polymerase specialized sigma24 family protein